MSYFKSIQLQDENGVPYGVKQINGKPRTSSMDYLYDVAEGNVANHESLVIRGVLSNVPTAETMIADGIITPTTRWITAQQLKVKSSSTADTSAGTGARSVYLYGVDTNGAALNELVTLNGTTAVTTTGSFVTVNYAVVATAGTGGVNAGNITINNNADTNAVEYIPIGFNRSMTSAWQTYADQSMYILSLSASTGSAKTMTIRYYIAPAGGLFYREYIMELYAGVAQVTLPCPFAVPANSRVYVTGASSQAGSRLIVTTQAWVEQ